jgi:hypothetical protein
VTTSAARVEFSGRVHAAPVGKTWTSSVVMPAVPGGTRPSVAQGYVYLIQYLALLDWYERGLSVLLSGEEAVVLDATKFGVPPSPGPGPTVGRDHRFNARHLVSRPDITALLGGSSRVDVNRHLAFARRNGQTGVAATLVQHDFVNQIAPMQSFGLTAMHLNYYWQSSFVIEVGARLWSSSGQVLGKNPFQLDAVAAARAAQEFAATFPNLDAVTAGGGRLIVETPELGDTWGPMSFQLRGIEGDRVRAAIAANNPTYFSTHATHVALDRFELAADQQYQAGFRLELVTAHSVLEQRVAQATTSVTATPSLAGFRDDLANNTETLGAAVGYTVGAAGLGHLHADDPSLDATNGAYNQFPFLFATQISTRRPDAASPAVRAVWNLAMRYWNKANVAYLEISYRLREFLDGVYSDRKQNPRVASEN